MLLALAAIVMFSDTLEQKQEQLLNAIIQVESSGNDAAVGDSGNAIGCLQIWNVYWMDATEFDRAIGGEYRDCYNRGYAKRVFRAYMRRYAREAWTDPHKFDPEKVARIHNGGPRGHQKRATLKYWDKVLSVTKIKPRAPAKPRTMIPKYSGINVYRTKIVY